MIKPPTIQDERELEIRRLRQNLKQYRARVTEVHAAYEDWFASIEGRGPNEHAAFLALAESLDSLFELAGLPEDAK